MQKLTLSSLHAFSSAKEFTRLRFQWSAMRVHITSFRYMCYVTRRIASAIEQRCERVRVHLDIRCNMRERASCTFRAIPLFKELARPEWPEPERDYRPLI